MFRHPFEMKYTWNDSWNLPYESIWGRMEKFRAVNVLQPAQVDNVIKIGNSNRYLIFSEDMFIYRQGTVKFAKHYTLFNTDTHMFDEFASLDGIFDDKIRFCPICMKRGYHSYIHQIGFLKCCFKHKDTILKYRCDCNDTYILNRKIAESKIFQCEYCGKEIDGVPSVNTGILNSWWSDEKIIFRRKTSIYKKIYVADFLYTCFKNDGRFRTHKELNEKQKQVLYEIVKYGKTEINPRCIIKITNNYKIIHKVVMSELINQYIAEKYSKDTILKHFGHISSRSYKYEIENYDIKLLSLFFILKELQNKRYIDLIDYNFNVGMYENCIRKYTDDEGFIIDFIEDTYYNMGINMDKCPELYNMILKEYIRIRYTHIYSCFKNNYPEPYPNVSGKEVSYRNWNYPVYVFVQTQDDKILVY